MATVDPNGSKCAAVPFNHLGCSISCVTVGILLSCNDKGVAEIPAAGLDGLAGKAGGQIKDERQFCLKCSSRQSFSFVASEKKPWHVKEEEWRDAQK